jgi:hypothetical protein
MSKSHVGQCSSLETGYDFFLKRPRKLATSLHLYRGGLEKKLPGSGLQLTQIRLTPLY